MSKASRITYLTELKNGNLKQNAVAILDFIKNFGPISTFELRNRLVYPHQTLTSRLTVLMDFGLIKVIDIDQREVQGRMSSCSVYQYVESEFEQKDLEQDRLAEKAENWLKGYDKYKEILNITLTNN